jgi:hypothetical protein
MNSRDLDSQNVENALAVSTMTLSSDVSPLLCESISLSQNVNKKELKC